MSTTPVVGGERRRRPWVWLLAPQRIAGERGDVVPSTTPGDLGLAAEQVWLESNGGTRLHGWFVPVAGPAPAVLVVHGWGGSASLMLPFAPELHRAGFHAFFLDVRNHGLSEPDRFVSMPRFADDLEEALDWLSERPEVTTIGVIGHSVGAGAAIFSASRGRSPEAVVSVAAPADPGDLMRELMARLPRPLLGAALAVVQRIIGARFEDFAPRHRISLVESPMLLVHGDADSVVPVASLHELAVAQPRAELLVVEGGGHSDFERFAPHIGEITGFLSRHLKSDDGRPLDRGA
jgi:uncharacterized protein